MILALFTLAATLVVLWHVLHVTSTLDIARFGGQRVRFAGMAACWSLCGAGAVAVTLGLHYGGDLLLLAIAIHILSDRRSLP